MSLLILAIVGVRNEQIHIRRCLSDLIRDGIDVALLDNGATDATLAIAQEFLGRGLIFIVPLAWTGSFYLLRVLKAKQQTCPECHVSLLRDPDHADRVVRQGDPQTCGRIVALVAEIERWPDVTV